MSQVLTGSKGRSRGCRPRISVFVFNQAFKGLNKMCSTCLDEHVIVKTGKPRSVLEIPYSSEPHAVSWGTPPCPFLPHTLLVSPPSTLRRLVPHVHRDTSACTPVLTLFPTDSAPQLSPGPRAEIFNLDTIDTLGLVILCCGAHNKESHRRMRTPYLYPLEARSTPPPVAKTKNVSGPCQMFPGGGRVTPPTP